MKNADHLLHLLLALTPAWWITQTRACGSNRAVGVRGNIKVTAVQRVSEHDRWDWPGPGSWVSLCTWATKHPAARVESGMGKPNVQLRKHLGWEQSIRRRESTAAFFFFFYIYSLHLYFSEPLILSSHLVCQWAAVKILLVCVVLTSL